jgi:hypothetical protein
MEATKNGLPVNKRPRMAADLLWFASASLGAGLLAAIVAAALVMLLAQPGYVVAPGNEQIPRTHDVSAKTL